jgi:hypothetical protein
VRTIPGLLQIRRQAVRAINSESGRMPQYFFKIRGAEVGHDEIRAALHDDAAALDHACLMVQQLRAAGGYDDPGLVVDVLNELGTRVLSVPFLAACA